MPTSYFLVMARHHSSSMFLTPPTAAPAAFVFRNSAVGPVAALGDTTVSSWAWEAAAPPTVPTRSYMPPTWPGACHPYPPNLSMMALRF